MAFTVQKAVREKVYTKTILFGASGSGKSFSALRLATGMLDELYKDGGGKILVANTEASRGRYYANEFTYDIVDMEPPHWPERYVELITFAVDSGYDILIIDSGSHEWEGTGGCLELQQQAGGQYQSWAKITPRHNKFVETIGSSKIHIIMTARGKDVYDVSKNEQGKTKVEKLGVGSKQREGIEYEFTLSFLLDQKTNMAEVQKDNTHIFEHLGAVQLTEDHGKKIIQWANTSKVEPKRAPIPTPVAAAPTTFAEPPVTTPEIAEAPPDPIKDLIALCKEKIAAGIARDTIYDVIEASTGTRQPNKIKDYDLVVKAINNVKELSV